MLINLPEKFVAYLYALVRLNRQVIQKNAKTPESTWKKGLTYTCEHIALFWV